MTQPPVRAVEPTATAGDVVVYRSGTSERAAHDHATCSEIARRLAALKRFRFAGEHDGRPPSAQDCAAASRRNRYFVPTDTLIGVEHARTLGIEDEQDLFGGVVPHPFVATKCISHPLVDDEARAPAGWSVAFGRKVRGAVLRGFAAFSVEDAERAAVSLFVHGPVRIKRALGIGGFGQAVVRDPHALHDALASTDSGEVLRYGISLEQDLSRVTTYSVGQVRVDDLLASYCGTQRLTENNEGQLVYGGSDLRVVRGDFDALLALELVPAARQAVAHARLYDSAAHECFAGLFASRRNYDVAHGVDAAGDPCSGVLEQSWRVGGASGAEVEALLAFRNDPMLNAVRATSTEVYGTSVSPPAGATIYFAGTDDRVGPLTKYALVEPHVHP